MKWNEVPKSVAFGVTSLFSVIYGLSYYFIMKGGVAASQDPILQNYTNWDDFVEMASFGVSTGIVMFLFFAWGCISCGIREYNEYRTKNREETSIE